MGQNYLFHHNTESSHDSRIHTIRARNNTRVSLTNRHTANVIMKAKKAFAKYNAMDLVSPATTLSLTDDIVPSAPGIEVKSGKRKRTPSPPVSNSQQGVAATSSGRRTRRTASPLNAPGLYAHITNDAHRQQWINASSKPFPPSVNWPRGVRLLMYPGKLAIKAVRRHKRQQPDIPTLAEEIKKMDVVCKLTLNDWINLPLYNTQTWNQRKVFVMFHDPGTGTPYFTDLPGGSNDADIVISPEPNRRPFTGVQQGTPVAVAFCTVVGNATLEIDYLCSVKKVKHATLSMLRFIEDWARTTNFKLIKLSSMEGAWPYYIRAGYKRTPDACTINQEKENEAIKTFYSYRGNEARRYAAFGGKVLNEDKSLLENINHPVYPIYSKCLRT
jgi:hypothetical protein